MKINTTQASNILGIGKHQVHVLVRRGDLKDYGSKQPGAQRHYYWFDEDEVRALHNRRAAAGTATTPPRSNGHGHIGHAATPPPEPPPTVLGMPARLVTIDKRLASLEEKIDRLLAAWQ